MSTGYSWTNTSQWSNIPAGNANQNNNNSQPPQSPSNGDTNQGQNNGFTTNSTEPRRDMITRLYQQILGREPDNAGLNYYLFNTNILEAQIAKEMFESTEHQDVLAKAKDVREIVIKLNENTKELDELKAKLQNAESLSSNYKILLDQKTQLINSLRSQNEPTPSKEDLHQSQETQNKPQNNDSGLMLDDPFAEDNQQKSGCLGFIKNLFKFS